MLATDSMTLDDIPDNYLASSAPPNLDTSDPSKYVQDRAPDSNIHYNIRTLSYSGLLTLHTCPRKFELNRLLPRVHEQDENGHLDFGTIVGNGIQEYLISGNLDKAILRAFLDWPDHLESERGLKFKKTFWHGVQAIQKFTLIRNSLLSQYEVATFNGKPACELGFAIDCGNGFRYRGKLDALLIHKIKREFLVLECKTTGANIVDEAMYKNSNQGVGYGVVIDAVAHQMEMESNSYDVLYPVYMTRKDDWEFFRFTKSNTQRALWLQSLLIDVAHISQYQNLEYYPTHGESCYSFGKPCNHFGTCGLSNQYLVGDLDKVSIKLDKVTDYPLEFSIQELVEAQIAKG